MAYLIAQSFGSDKSISYSKYQFRQDIVNSFISEKQEGIAKSVKVAVWLCDPLPGSMINSLAHSLVH